MNPPKSPITVHSSNSHGAWLGPRSSPGKLPHVNGVQAVPGGGKPPPGGLRGGGSKGVVGEEGGADGTEGPVAIGEEERAAGDLLQFLPTTNKLKKLQNFIILSEV